ncbi:MAG: MaoC family dehydratase N-terminal domain-containing protein [Acuticoccus sp.]
MDHTDLIGRTETATDTISAATLARLSATLGRDDPALAHGAPCPPLAHWFHFLPATPAAEIGPDGHARRGGFLPAVPDLPRRMWAGSRLAFPGTLTVGARLERRSTIAATKERQGQTGRLLFVTVRHEIGPPGAPPLVVDEHDIVYRGASGAAGRGEPADPGLWQRTLTPDPVLLFRFSALTFNGHRIHYDAPYVRQVEGYPGLIVHGPLVATLLLDLVRRERPEARVAAFSFRALSPFFVDAPLTLNGTPQADGTIALWAADAYGAVGMRATATVAP